MDTDVIKLIESKHEVTLLGNNLNEFCVKFYGPRGELGGEKGLWGGFGEVEGFGGGFGF
jgi:hypothetical protein